MEVFNKSKALKNIALARRQLEHNIFINVYKRSEVEYRFKELEKLEDECLYNIDNFASDELIEFASKDYWQELEPQFHGVRWFPRLLEKWLEIPIEDRMCVCTQKGIYIPCNFQELTSVNIGTGYAYLESDLNKKTFTNVLEINGIEFMVKQVRQEVIPIEHTLNEQYRLVKFSEVNEKSFKFNELIEINNKIYEQESLF